MQQSAAYSALAQQQVAIAVHAAKTHPQLQVHATLVQQQAELVAQAQQQASTFALHVQQQAALATQALIQANQAVRSDQAEEHSTVAQRSLQQATTLTSQVQQQVAAAWKALQQATKAAQEAFVEAEHLAKINKARMYVTNLQTQVAACRGSTGRAKKVSLNALIDEHNKRIGELEKRN
ncbi:MAG: hypothetical protein LLG04_06140 [Parachlamydia sp.]|nr:hypothetical protein [Parachlamydia sp.]